MYDSTEWVDPLSGTCNNAETDSDSEGAGGEREYIGHACRRDTCKADAGPGTTDSDTANGETASK